MVKLFASGYLCLLLIWIGYGVASSWPSTKTCWSTSNWERKRPGCYQTYARELWSPIRIIGRSHTVQVPQSWHREDPSDSNEGMTSSSSRTTDYLETSDATSLHHLLRFLQRKSNIYCSLMTVWSANDSTDSSCLLWSFRQSSLRPSTLLSFLNPSLSSFLTL